MSDATTPLDVYADLRVDVGEATLTVRGYGDLVVVDAPTLGALRRAPRAGDLLDRLRDADVTLDCRVRGRSVALAGPGHDPGPLSRVLGVGSLQLRPGGLLLTLLD